MSHRPTPIDQKIKNQQAVIVAYAKEVEKLRSDIIFLQHQVTYLQSQQKAKNVSSN